jgi:hypothetical protein
VAPEFLVEVNLAVQLGTPKCIREHEVIPGLTVQQPNYCRLAKNSDEETLPINLETLDVFFFEDDVFDQVQFAYAVRFGA